MLLRALQAFFYFVSLDCLLEILSEIGEAHVALAEERIVESQCGAHGLRLVTLRCHMLQVVAQQRTVVGMGTVLNNLMGAVHRSLAPEVGNALLVTMMSTSCSVESTWQHMGTTADIFPPLAVDGVVNMLTYPLRS